jgi:hypothetical protein
MAVSSSPSSASKSSSRRTKYSKACLRTKFSPVQIKRIIAADKHEYADLARKYKMSVRTAFFFRKQAELSEVNSAERKKRVNRLFVEGIRFCLARTRSYSGRKSKRLTKSVTYDEILNFMETNCANYDVEENWIPQERTLRGMISADKKKRNPTGHKREVNKMKNRSITLDQQRRMEIASRKN